MLIQDPLRKKLNDLINIGVFQAADILNSLVNKPINLEVPYIKIINSADAIEEYDYLKNNKLSIVQMDFGGPLSGVSQLFFTKENAHKLTHAFAGYYNLEEDTESLFEATFIEIGNIVLNSLMGSICNVLDTRIRFKAPFYLEQTMQDVIKNNLDDSKRALLAKTKFTISELELSGDFILFLKFETLSKIIEIIDEHISTDNE